MNKSSLRPAITAVMLGLCAAAAAWAGAPPKRVIVVPPLPFTAPSLQPTPGSLFRPVAKPYPYSPRYTITWNKLNYQKMRDVLMPTLLPTAREPLRHDLTPMLPCPAGEYRQWQSYGSMPAAEFVLAGLLGYSPGNLCSPLPHH